MTSIFVAKLDYGVNQDELKSVFEVYGKVNRVTIPTDKETGKPKGFAFVEMVSAEEASAAISALDGSTLRGRQIAVKAAEDRPGGRPAPGNHGGGQGGAFRPSNNYQSGQQSHGERPPRTDSEPRFRERDSIPAGENRAERPETAPLINPLKTEVRKKDKTKERPKDVPDGRARQQKMEAYKKSGKNNRFFPEDDDDDF